MLRYELSCPKGGLLLSVLMLKDAGCNHYAVAGVDQVVSHESRHFADDGHKAFLAHLRHLLRVSDALVAPYCSVHRFSLPPYYSLPYYLRPGSLSGSLSHSLGTPPQFKTRRHKLGGIGLDERVRTAIGGDEQIVMRTGSSTLSKGDSACAIRLDGIRARGA